MVRSLFLPVFAASTAAILLVTYALVANGRSPIDEAGRNGHSAVSSVSEPKIEPALVQETVGDGPAGAAQKPPPTSDALFQALTRTEPSIPQPPAEPPEGVKSDSLETAKAENLAETELVAPAPNGTARTAPEERIEVAQAATTGGPAPQPRPAAPQQQAPAPQQQAPQVQAAPQGRQPAHIDRNNLLFLVRSTLMALHQANETGNYSVLREMSAPSFQAANNQARLAEIFANLRTQKLDLSAVSILEPELTSVPSVDANGNLLIEGAYPQIPPQVSFRLLFIPLEGKWRLQGIGINSGPPPAVLGQSPSQPVPAAQPAPPTPAQQPATRPAPASQPPRAVAPRPAPQPRRTPAPAEPADE